MTTGAAADRWWRVVRVQSGIGQVRFLVGSESHLPTSLRQVDSRCHRGANTHGDPFFNQGFVMFWVIQQGMHEARDFARLRRILKVMELPHVAVRVLKNGRLIASDQTDPAAPEPIVPADQPVFVCGTYALGRLARQRGWNPGALDAAALGFNQCLAGWGEAMLNAHAVCGTVRAIAVPTVPFFARPMEDNKAFNGRTFTPEAFELWRQAVLAKPEPGVLNPDTRLLVAPLKTIFREHRFFVVGGQVVAASVYKQGGQLFVSATVDDDAWAFAQDQVNRWRPMDHFVIDVATLEKGHRIVEVNGLSVSGFYAADVGAIVMAVEDWYAANPSS